VKNSKLRPEDRYAIKVGSIGIAVVIVVYILLVLVSRATACRPYALVYPELTFSGTPRDGCRVLYHGRWYALNDLSTAATSLVLVNMAHDEWVPYEERGE